MPTQEATVQQMRSLAYFEVSDALYDPRSVVTISAKHFPLMGYAGILVMASRPNSNTACIYETTSCDVGATALAERGTESVC